MTFADLLALGAILAPAGLACAWRLRPDATADGTVGAARMARAAQALWVSFGLAALLSVGAWRGWAESGVLASAAPAALAAGLLVGLVAAAVGSFSQRHMAADPQLGRYAERLLLVAAAAMGVAFAADAATFLVAWVLSGRLLAALIGHVEGWPQAAAAARRARRSFLVGDVALGVGLLALAADAGSLRLDALTAHAVAEGGALGPALLVLAGAVARSAILPFHGWLMTSMTAPTPVSALMHAGLVNAGGVAMVKLAPLFLATPLALTLAFGAGAATALFGGLVMLTRSDVKRSLAGSTVAQMGFMMMQCGLGAFAHALFHIIAHGFFKAALFLGAAGNVGVKTRAAGDWRVAPAIMVVGLAALVAGGYAVGAPFALEKPSTLLALFALATGAQAAGAALGARPKPAAAGLMLALGAACGGVYGLSLAALEAALPPMLAEGRAAGPLEWAAAAAFALAWAAANLPGLRARVATPALHMFILNAGRAA